jgi:hypothetical protein
VSTDQRRGFFGRLTDRLTKSSVELEADELHDTSLRLGATPIAEVKAREPVTVCGEVRSVALRPSVQVPALVVEIYDGTEPMQLIWLGRRAIAGIDPGVMLRAKGRATYRRGVRTIFNAEYEIVPTGA